MDQSTLRKPRIRFLAMISFLIAGLPQFAYAACLICKPFGGGSKFEYNGSYCPSGTTFVKNCPAPPPPTLPGAPWLSYGLKSPMSFELSWTHSVVAAAYKYQKRVNDGAWSALIVAPSNPMVVNATNPGNYQYRVFACNSNGCGSSSNTISVEVSEPVFTVPENMVTYTYDSMGRLTFVEDGINGNRDYDYDKAGNRDEVLVGKETDEVPLPPPPASPGSLSCSFVAPNVYRASWSGVAGASYYIVRSTATTSPETQLTSTTHFIDQGGATCKWVKACNSANVCSEKSNF